MNSRLRSRLLLLVPAIVVALLWPAPAQAAEEIGLSSDGVSWSFELAVSLFEPERRWVPGDDEIRTFQVRNEGPSAANVKIEALSPGGDVLLAADIAFSARVDGGAWTPLDLAVPSQELTVQPLTVDRPVPVEIRAVFDPASTNETQNKIVPLALRITLSGDVPSDVSDVTGGSDRPDGGDRGGFLPSTGATLGLEILVAAAALCFAGALLIARQTSREERHDG